MVGVGFEERERGKYLHQPMLVKLPVTENKDTGLIFGREKEMEWIVTFVLFEPPLEASDDHGLYKEEDGLSGR